MFNVYKRIWSTHELLYYRHTSEQRTRNSHKQSNVLYTYTTNNSFLCVYNLYKYLNEEL